jgi:hypothetical protein
MYAFVLQPHIDTYLSHTSTNFFTHKQLREMPLKAIGGDVFPEELILGDLGELLPCFVLP